MLTLLDPETSHLLLSREMGWQFGQLRFSVAEMIVLLTALTVAMLSAYGLLRIGVREDRQARLDVIRQTVADDEVEQAPGLRWYSRLAAKLMATPVVNIANRQRLVAALAQAGIDAEHHHLGTLIACKIASGLAFAA